LNDSAGRAEFVRHLYILLCVEIDRDRNWKRVITELENRIRNDKLNSMFTKDVPGDPGRKHARTGDDHQDGDHRAGSHRAGRDGDHRVQLRAHGFEVKPEVIVDDSGGTWEPLFEVPATLFYFFFGIVLLSVCDRFYSPVRSLRLHWMLWPTQPTL